MDVTGREEGQYQLGHFNIDSPTSDWSMANSSSHEATPTNDSRETPAKSTNATRVADYSFIPAPSSVITKGPPKSEVQLRYLLQIMMEANCLEIASLISIVLKDALALIRIVNAARTSPSSPLQTSSHVESEQQKVKVSRIYQNLKALEVWAQTECVGYVPFFQAIQPQLNSLRTFLIQQQSMSYQQPLNTNKASATAAAKYGSNYTPQPHTDKTTTSSVYNSYNELTTNSRKNSPASASLPPIC